MVIRLLDQMSWRMLFLLEFGVGTLASGLIWKTDLFRAFGGLKRVGPLAEVPEQAGTRLG